MGGVVLTIGVVTPLAWGCLALITGHYLIPLPMIHHWQWWVTAQAGPPLLLFFAAFAWMHAYRWRRMARIRQSMMGDRTTALIRGEHQQTAAIAGPSSLERWCGRLVILALASTPYWLGAPQPEVWVGAGLITWWLARACFR